MPAAVSTVSSSRDPLSRSLTHVAIGVCMCARVRVCACDGGSAQAMIRRDGEEKYTNDHVSCPICLRTKKRTELTEHQETPAQH
eukprot:1051966-Rhodomonas_salina.6